MFNPFFDFRNSPLSRILPNIHLRLFLWKLRPTFWKIWNSMSTEICSRRMPTSFWGRLLSKHGPTPMLKCETRTNNASNNISLDAAFETKKKWFCEILDDPWMFPDEFWWILISKLFFDFERIFMGFHWFLGAAGPPLPIASFSLCFAGVLRAPPIPPISL